MELPEKYFPIQPCPYKNLKKNTKRKEFFAECGSHQSVDLDIKNGKHLTVWPQKGQQGVTDLFRMLPTIPLYEKPLEDKWISKDRILGFSNYQDILCKMTAFSSKLPIYRSEIKKERYMSTEIKECSKAVDQMMKDSNFYNDGLKILREKLPLYAELAYEQMVDITSAYNVDCLSAYNREFYGGLLALAKSSAETESLVHVKGEAFNEICASTTSSGSIRGLKECRLTDTVRTETVFQVCARNTDRKTLVCARKANSCLLLSLDEDGKLHKEMQNSNFNGSISSICFSPYVENEILVSGRCGSLYLWDVNSGMNDPHTLRQASAVTNPSRTWSAAHFGGHPRQLVVSDCQSMQVVDHRTNYREAVSLFSLPGSHTKDQEQVMAACLLGFPYHAVATDYSLFVLDSRFPSTPVLNYSTEMMSPPQYLQYLDIEYSSDKLLLLASQQPAEVICFPVNISEGRPPTAPVLPWRVSRVDDLCTTLAAPGGPLSKRFQFSLAGFAVSPTSIGDAFSVYQLDSCGDLFYQTYTPDILAQPSSSQSTAGGETLHNRNSGSVFQHFQACDESNTAAAKARVEEWLLALAEQAEVFETENFSKLSSAREDDFKSVELDKSLVSDVFSCSTTSTEILEHEKIADSRRNIINPDRPHKALKSFRRLAKAKFQSALLLALKDGKDIRKPLFDREVYHMKIRLKRRRALLKEKGAIKKREPALSDFDVAFKAILSKQKRMKTKAQHPACTREDSSSVPETQSNTRPGHSCIRRDNTPSLFSSSSSSCSDTERGQVGGNESNSLMGDDAFDSDDDLFVTQANSSLSMKHSFSKGYKNVLSWLMEDNSLEAPSSPKGLTVADIKCDSGHSKQEHTPCDLASICSSQRSQTLARPEMKRVVDPALAGFLMSPEKCKHSQRGTSTPQK